MRFLLFLGFSLLGCKFGGFYSISIHLCLYEVYAWERLFWLIHPLVKIPTETFQALQNSFREIFFGFCGEIACVEFEWSFTRFLNELI